MKRNEKAIKSEVNWMLFCWKQNWIVKSIFSDLNKDDITFCVSCVDFAQRYCNKKINILQSKWNS